MPYIRVNFDQHGLHPSGGKANREIRHFNAAVRFQLSTVNRNNGFARWPEGCSQAVSQYSEPPTGKLHLDIISTNLCPFPVTVK